MIGGYKGEGMMEIRCEVEVMILGVRMRDDKHMRV